MAKVRTAKSGVAPQQVENPIAPAPFALTHEERIHLRGLLADPVFVKAWTNAKAREPSIYIQGTLGVAKPLDGAQGMQIGNNRFHEMRGWKMFEVALTTQVNDPAPIKTVLQETWTG